jgi:hypothetical protein
LSESGVESDADSDVVTDDLGLVLDDEKLSLLRDDVGPNDHFLEVDKEERAMLENAMPKLDRLECCRLGRCNGEDCTGVDGKVLALAGGGLEESREEVTGVERPFVLWPDALLRR